MPLAAPLTVALDVRILQSEDALRDIGHYTRGLTEALLAQGGDTIRFVLFVDGERPEPQLRTDGAARAYAIAPPEPTKRLARLLDRYRAASCEMRSIRRALESSRARILHVASPLHGPFNWEPIEGVATVATVYDLIPLLDRPRYLERWPDAVRKRYLARLAQLPRLAHLFAISGSVARDLADSVAVNAARIGVAYPALRDAFLGEAEAPPAREDFVLAFASSNPSKQTPLLLEAYGRLEASLLRHHALLLVGPQDEALRSETMAWAREYGIENNTEYCAAPSDANLRNLYERAALVVLPSSHEGFGLHALEAMACGAPVVGSDIPVFREMLPNESYFFRSGDAESLANTMRRALSDLGRLRSLSELGLGRALDFSWRRTAAEVSASYLRLAAEARPKGL